MNFIKRYLLKRELADLEIMVNLHEKTIGHRQKRLDELRKKRSQFGEWDPRIWFPVAGLNTEINKLNAIVTLHEKMYPQWKSQIEDINYKLK